MDSQNKVSQNSDKSCGVRTCAATEGALDDHLVYRAADGMGCDDALFHEAPARISVFFNVQEDAAQ